MFEAEVDGRRDQHAEDGKQEGIAGERGLVVEIAPIEGAVVGC